MTEMTSFRTGTRVRTIMIPQYALVNMETNAIMENNSRAAVDDQDVTMP